jgi:hypothetical protein
MNDTNGYRGILDPSQQGVEAHAIKPPEGGIKSEPTVKAVPLGKPTEEAQAEAKRIREANKIAKQEVDKINDLLKKEYTSYKQSPRTSQDRAEYKETVEKLKQYRDMVVNRTRTEQPPAGLKLTQFGVNDDNQKRVLKQPTVEEGVSSSTTSSPFRVFLYAPDATKPDDKKLKVQTGLVTYGISATPLSIVNKDTPIARNLAVNSYIYLLFVIDSSLGITSCTLTSGAQWSGFPKYINVNSQNKAKPYQQRLYYPIAKVMPYVTGGPVYGTRLTDTTQLAQLATSHVRLELWAVDGLPMWIPSPGVILNPVV